MVGSETSVLRFSDMGFAAALPFTIVVGSAIVVLLADMLLPVRRKWILVYVSLLGVVVAAISIALLWGRKIDGFGGAISLDRFSSFFWLLFLLGTALVLLISSSYARRENIQRGEYYSLMLFATSGAMLMASAGDLVVLFLGLEIFSLCLCVLSGFFRERSISVEAAVKYFVLGAFASGFFLYGIALCYGATGSTLYTNLQFMLSSGSRLPSPLVLAACAMLLVGLLFKVGSVPFHMWIPDVYEGAPTSITGYMSVISKAAALAAFIRIFAVSVPVIQLDLSRILWVAAVCTMTLGNVVAVVQTNIKRMLAYSSIAHAGYVLVALTAGTEAGYSGVLFYVLAYTFMTIGAFGVVTLLTRAEVEAVEISSFSGIAKRHPFLSVAMAVFMISLAGIPPTAGFFGKFYVFSAAVGAGYASLAVIGVLNSLVSVYIYMRVVFLMYKKEESEGIEVSSSRATIVALTICVLGTIVIGIFPSGVASLVASAVAAIF
ncbi:MAG: NADH-quinone oxidoreductase subunit N [Candidatus Eisenbacteria bacterium]|nr:NADH-quinone oxidoreductase subunit N [Candidatus Eisenbacteria bacterium]